MDWSGAIEKNSTALKRIVAMLAGMAGLSAPSLLPLWEKVSPSGERSEQEEQRRMRGVGRIADVSDPSSTPHPTSPALRSGSATFSHKGRREGNRPTLPRRLHRVILRLLRPAESAVRRLIVIAARGLVVPPSPQQRPRPPEPKSIFVRSRTAAGVYIPRGTPLPGQPLHQPPHSMSFPPFDPLLRPFRRRSRPTPVCEPRISYAGPFARLSPIKLRRSPKPDDALDATRLTLRLNALATALDDLPKQAQRLARWRANRDAVQDRGQFTFFPGRGAAASRQAPSEKSKLSPALPRRFRRISPLRPGRPPGSLRRPDHEIHDLLTELHGLAFDVLEQPDTS